MLTSTCSSSPSSNDFPSFPASVSLYLTPTPFFYLSRVVNRMAYIEAELAKRRGTNPASSSDPKPSEQPQQAAAFVDPQEELYAIAEQYRNEQREKAKGEDDDGGNVMNSMAMLTASTSLASFWSSLRQDI
jgi:hypothetical protein